MRVCVLCQKKFGNGDGMLFRVPKDPLLRAHWETICSKNLRASSTICSDHFAKSAIAQVGKRSILLPHAKPLVEFKTSVTLQHLPLCKEGSPTKRLAEGKLTEIRTDPQIGVFKCSLCQKQCRPDNGKYFRTPDDESRRKLWSDSCGMQLFRDAVVCEDHFSPKSFLRLRNQVTLLPNAVPLPPRLSKMQIDAHIGSEQIVIDDDNRSEISVSLPVNSSRLLLKDPLDLNNASSTCQGDLRKEYADKETQTDPYMFLCENYASKCRQLESEIKELKLQIIKSSNAMNTIYKIFTEGQIRKLMFPSNINWREHDMENALELYKCGPRAYKYLYKKGFPLPHISSIQRWKRKPKFNNLLNTNSSAPPNESVEKEEEEEEEEEVNEFSGDENDWFDDFYEEETVNNEKISEEANTVKKPECEKIVKPKDFEILRGILNGNEKDRNKGTLDTKKEAEVLPPTSQYASPELSAIIANSNAKVFIAKRPLELDKSKEEQNSTINAQSPSESLVTKAATSTSRGRDMPDLNCTITNNNVKGPLEKSSEKQEGNKTQNVTILNENQGDLLDYNEFLNSINSEEYL